MDEDTQRLLEDVFQLMDALEPEPGNGQFDINKGKTWSTVMGLNDEEWPDDCPAGGCSAHKTWKFRIAQISQFSPSAAESKMAWFNQEAWVLAASCRKIG